jgi:hypothetical protein
MGAKWLCFVTFAFRAGAASAYLSGFVSSISFRRPNSMATMGKMGSFIISREQKPPIFTALNGFVLAFFELTHPS